MAVEQWFGVTWCSLCLFLWKIGASGRNEHWIDKMVWSSSPTYLEPNQHQYTATILNISLDLLEIPLKYLENHCQKPLTKANKKRKHDQLKKKRIGRRWSPTRKGCRLTPFHSQTSFGPAQLQGLKQSVWETQKSSVWIFLFWLDLLGDPKTPSSSYQMGESKSQPISNLFNWFHDSQQGTKVAKSI